MLILIWRPSKWPRNSHRPRSEFALSMRLGRGIRRSGKEERRKKKCKR